MIIYGAGMAGLMAGNYLKKFSPTIHEAQSSLPNNHGALLRFKTNVCGEITGIPFKKVKINKAICFDGSIYTEPNIKFSNMYSQKVTGEIINRSIGNLDAGERYIAPYDYINQMASKLDIEYDSKLTTDFLQSQKNSNHAPVISTIPMPMLMDMVGWQKPEFKWKSITSVWGKINSPKTDVYQTIYYPDPKVPYYRISITGDTYIAEYDGKINIDDAISMSATHLRDFGINGTVEDVNIKEQNYGKLVPIDDKVRKEFILYMTDEYRVYSLGRFATWRQILLDDLARDLKVIESMIDYRDDYSKRLSIIK